MKKFKLFFSFVGLLFTNTREVLKNLLHFTNATKAKNLALKKYNLKNGFPSIDLLQFNPEFSETVTHYTYLDGTSRVTDVAFLKQLARRFTDCRYIEIGSWRGESLANLSTVCKEIVSITLSKDEMRQFKLPEQAIKVTGLLSQNLPNLKKIEHNSHTLDLSNLVKSFDLIFVDGDHTFEGVKKDTETAFKLLKDEKSIIVWHDYGFTFETPNWEVIAGIMEGAPSDEHRKKIFRVSNTLCAIYLTEKMAANFPELWLPTKLFNVRISAEKFQTNS